MVRLQFCESWRPLTQDWQSMKQSWRKLTANSEWQKVVTLSRTGTIKKAVKQLYDVDSENRSRRNNQVFYGVNDSGSETWAQSELLLNSICKENLDLELQWVGRLHRTGHYNAAKNRPILANFQCPNVLSKARNLRELHTVSTKITHPKQEKRLWGYVKVNNKNEKRCARLSIDKLIANSKTYTKKTRSSHEKLIHIREKGPSDTISDYSDSEL